MESPLGLAFVFLLLLLAMTFYLIRETVPEKRTLSPKPQTVKNMTWEQSFQSITPGFLIRAPVKDASGNVF
jgi:hypothetical protein